METKNSRAFMAERLKRFSGFSLIILLLGILFSYAMFQGGFVSWFLFFSFLPVAVHSLLLSVYPLAFHAERDISSNRLYAGDRLRVTITAERKFPFPLLFLVVEDAAAGCGGHKHMFFPGFKKRLTVSYEIKNISRGEHLFHFVRFKTGDLFGLAEKETRVSLPEAILVFPRMNPVYFESIKRMLETGRGTGGFQFNRDASLVAGIREYEPGDRFSWIDWKATARTSSMMTKEFEVKRSNDPLFVLDASAAKHFEKMVEFAVSAIRSVLQSGGQAGLYVPGRENAFFPPKSGERQLMKILYCLAKVQPETEKPLAKEDAALLQHRGRLIFITSELTELFLEKAELAVKRKQSVMIVLVRDRKVLQKEKPLIQEALKRGIHVETLDDGKTVFAGAKEA